MESTKQNHKINDSTGKIGLTLLKKRQLLKSKIDIIPSGRDQYKQGYPSEWIALQI